MFTKIIKQYKHLCLVMLGFFLVINFNFLVKSEQLNSLKVATDPTFPPFEMTSNNSAGLTGFDIHLMETIGRKLGAKIEFVPLPFDGIIGSLESGQVDAAISAITINAKRAQTIDFSRPYFKAGLAIAVSENNQTINGFADLKDKTIAVQIGTTGEKKAREIEGAKITTFNDSPAAIQELVNGNVEAVINDAPATLYALKTGNIQGVKIIDKLVTEEYYGIALPKKTPNPNLNRINQTIDKLIKEGTYQQIYQQWFGSQPPELPLVAPALDSGKQTETPPFDWKNLIKNLIFKGVPLTLGLTIVSFTFGLIGGSFIGWGQISGSHYIRRITRVYIEFFRGTPMLVQLYIIYFGLPSLFNSLGLNFQFDKYMAAAIALSINVAAYIAEIIRGGIQSIETGQWEACKSLGMSPNQTMGYVIFPQAFRRILPPLGNELISLIKDSSLAAVIGLDELFRQGQLIVADTYKAFLVYAVVAGVYLILTVLSSIFFKWLETLMTPGNKLVTFKRK